MRAAGKLAAQVLEMIAPHVKPGVTTNELNDLCAKYTEEQGAISAPLNYHGFPKSICTSVNHVICHSIPNDNPPLKEGDILNIDITVIKDGYHGDTSQMFLIGEVSAKDKRLCRIAQESLYLAIRKVRPGLKLGEIGNTIENSSKQAKQALRNIPSCKIIVATVLAQVSMRNLRSCITATAITQYYAQACVSLLNL